MLLALGVPLPTNVKPWKHFDVDAVMVSAYYILKSSSVRKHVTQKGLKDYLDFDGMVILDSGVFQLLNSGKTLDVDQIMGLYKSIDGADVKLSFDYPDDRIIEQYLKLRPYEVEPVVPADQYHLVKHFEDQDCEWIFVGRLAKALKDQGNRGFDFLEKTSSLFQKLTNKKLWAMGIGNYHTLPILAASKFNGSDSSSYRVAAAYGDVIVPGKGTRHISGRKKGKKNWGMKIAQENDLRPYLNRLNLTYDDLRTSFTERVIFNAYALIDEKATVERKNPLEG